MQASHTSINSARLHATSCRSTYAPKHGLNPLRPAHRAKSVARVNLKVNAEDGEAPRKPLIRMDKKSSKGPINVSRSNMLRASYLAGCACCSEMFAGAKSAKADEWNYIEPTGPRSWGGICSTSKSQSPIDLSVGDARDFALDPSIVNFVFKPVQTTVINTGHGTMQVNFNNEPLYTEYGDRLLKLLQLHFHTPSEHAFGSKRTDMEVHLVHQDVESGGLVVFGTLMEGDGSLENAGLAYALDYCPPPTVTGVQELAPAKIDPTVFVPKRGYRKFVNYNGSLTTPPCSEQIEWVVFGAPIKVTAGQVTSFKKYITDGGKTLGDNSRPFQGLNGRTVVRSGFNLANI